MHKCGTHICVNWEKCIYVWDDSQNQLKKEVQVGNAISNIKMLYFLGPFATPAS